MVQPPVSQDGANSLFLEWIFLDRKDERIVAHVRLAIRDHVSQSLGQRQSVRLDVRSQPLHLTDPLIHSLRLLSVERHLCVVRLRNTGRYNLQSSNKKVHNNINMNQKRCTVCNT